MTPTSAADSGESPDGRLDPAWQAIHADLLAENLRLRRALYDACDDDFVPDGVTLDHKTHTASVTHNGGPT